MMQGKFYKCLDFVEATTPFGSILEPYARFIHEKSSFHAKL